MSKRRKYFLFMLSFIWVPFVFASSPGGDEYGKLNSQKSNLEAQINAHQKSLETLIHKKNSSRDAKIKHQALEEMKKVHTDLQMAISQYNKALKELIYRFPEKGDATHRKYVPLKNKSIEQIEKEMGLDAALTAAKSKVDKKYQSFKEKEKAKQKENLTDLSSVDRLPASSEPIKTPKNEERIRLIK